VVYEEKQLRILNKSKRTASEEIEWFI
jgi:hypothetical protein